MARSAEVRKVLDRHTSEASELIADAGSYLLKHAFTRAWAMLGHSGLHGSVEKGLIFFEVTSMKNQVSVWVGDMQVCREEEIAKFNAMDEEAKEAYRAEHMAILRDIDEIVEIYGRLKGYIDEVEMEFENGVSIYRSPLQQALTDMVLLYNKIKGVKGEFSGVENVSVYVHGIESSGEAFLESVQTASSKGDLVMRIERKPNGKKQTIFAKINGDWKEITGRKLKDILKEKPRLHIVYDTDFKNEHRQRTSDQLAKNLTELGLINEKTKIDLFGHSYGGRRSFQFAMDYPDQIRSITTIGTPYHKNLAAGSADLLTKINKVDEMANNEDFHVGEYSEFRDMKLKHMRTDDGREHSNAFTDMRYINMKQAIKEVKAANPEVYGKLDDMDTTVIAGQDYTIKEKTGKDGKVIKKEKLKNSDGVVHIKSQQAKDLKGLIDERLVYKIKGQSLTDPAHLYETENKEFINKIQEVNLKYEEASR